MGEDRYVSDDEYAGEFRHEKKMLIVVGPQGSGNHVWAKILGLHFDVYGWRALKKKYWEGHHLEPFARAWDDPTVLTFPKDYSYFVTSCSIPYVYKEGHRVPPILEFIKAVENQNVRPIVAIVSRDKNIIELQQERVRGKITLNDALRAIDEIQDAHPDLHLHFLSYESLYLWRNHYLKFLNDEMVFPIAYDKMTKVDKILKYNANIKYIIDPGPQKLDKVVSKTYGDSLNV
tara:strand:+ start:127 stop:822 length:696 start_codon:yes stop_codon:yes gene_type:complete